MAKISISNISWGRTFSPRIVSTLRDAGCLGIEFVPGLLDHTEANKGAASNYVRLMSDYGLTCVGLHSLLYEMPHFRILDLNQREDLLDYCHRLNELCKNLNGKFMVFGSPSSRSLGNTSQQDAWKIAVDFFRRLAEDATTDDVFYLIEPLKNAEIIKTVEEGSRMVENVGHPNLGLHLDTRIFAQNKKATDIITQYADQLYHVHTGGQKLNFIAPDDGLDHATYAAALNNSGYHNFITLEMVRKSDQLDLPRLSAAIKYANLIYGNKSGQEEE